MNNNFLLKKLWTLQGKIEKATPEVQQKFLELYHKIKGTENNTISEPVENKKFLGKTVTKLKYLWVTPKDRKDADENETKIANQRNEETQEIEKGKKQLQNFSALDTYRWW